MEDLLYPLAVKYNTDKGSMHQYTKFYSGLFKREAVKRVLEIGIKEGGSLRMWKEWFPKASVIGIDCCSDCLFTEERIKTYWADQGNRQQLRDLPLGKDFDLIVDDGSHRLPDQIASLSVLFPLLRQGGYYVIEDIGDEKLHKEVGGRIYKAKQGNLLILRKGVA